MLTMIDAVIERLLRTAVALATVAASAALWWPVGALAATRIKEVASVQGVRANQIGRAHV